MSGIIPLFKDYTANIWKGHGRGIWAGGPAGDRENRWAIGALCVRAQRECSHVFDLLPWAIHQEEDGFRLSLLSTSPAHTSILLLLLVEARLNMLYLFIDAPRRYAVRLLLKLCRRMPVSVHWKVFFRPVYWTEWSHEFGNTVFHPMCFAWYIAF